MCRKSSHPTSRAPVAICRAKKEERSRSRTPPASDEDDRRRSDDGKAEDKQEREDDKGAEENGANADNNVKDTAE